MTCKCGAKLPNVPSYLEGVARFRCQTCQNISLDQVKLIHGADRAKQIRQNGALQAVRLQSAK